MGKLRTKGDMNIWWIIIGAVIALIVMVVVLVMFTSKSGTLEQGLLECSSKGGDCKSLEECQQLGGTVSSAFTCQSQSELKCCFGAKAGSGFPCTRDGQCLAGRCLGGFCA